MKPVLIFVSARLPFPCVEGHQLRSFGVLSQLSKFYDIHLLSILRKGETIDMNNDLGNLCSSIVGVPVSDNVISNSINGLSGLIRNQPLVVAKYVTPVLRNTLNDMMQRLRPVIVHFDLLPLADLSRDVMSFGCRWVINEHNVESDLLRQKLSTITSYFLKLVYRREIRLLSRFERRIIADAPLVLACSDEDNQRLVEFGGRSVCTVPNGVDTKRLAPSLAAVEPRRFVFLGGMGWYPNRLGMEWFIKEVLPLVVARLPDVTIELIGNTKPEITIPVELKDNIEQVGFVDDFVPNVQRATAMIVPINVGGGTRLKVVEGIALGKCIISTRKGAEGVGLTHGESVMFGDTPQAFADCMVDIVMDPALRQKIELSARRWAVDVFDWDEIGKTLAKAYQQLIL